MSRFFHGLFSPFRSVIWMRTILLFLFALLPTVLRPVDAARNVTVDDTDRRISYSPTSAWKSLATLTDRINKTSHYTVSNTKSAYAEFTFTGASNIYYVGYGLTSNSTLMNVIFDGNTFVVDIKRPSNSRAKAYLWSSGVIDPATTHTIKCQKTSASGGNDVNIDAFVLTVPDPVTTSPTSTSTSTTSTDETSATTSDSETTTPSSTSTTTSGTPVSIWIPPNGQIASATESESAPPAETPPPDSPEPSPPLSKANIATIVGSSLGAVAFIAVGIALYLFFARLKRHRNRYRYFKEKQNQGQGHEHVQDHGYGNNDDLYPMTPAPFVIPRPPTADNASSASRSFVSHSHSENTPTPRSSTRMLFDDDVTDIAGGPVDLIGPEPPPYSPERSSHLSLPTLPTSSLPTLTTSSLSPTTNRSSD